MKFILWPLWAVMYVTFTVCEVAMEAYKKFKEKA